ncbi:MAG TPA: DUF2905 domain-containing protein [Calditrichaeota bacterium]|nr:DUF2905 domain-containing protein [Calditrichota bacterium]
MRNILIISGLILISLGLLWPWLSKIPFGHLPGDIIIEKENLRVYIPIATMLLISLLLSLIFWLLRK